jgi:hypothetical protein
MAKRPSAFRQGDVSRVVKGAVKGMEEAGLGVGGVEIDLTAGKITVFTGKAELTRLENEWDAVE